MMRSALSALERLLLPNCCVSCDRALEPGRADELICGLCRSRLRPVIGGCERCCQPLPPIGPCRFCAGWPTALRWVHSAVWLGDEAREMLHHLKYQGYAALAEPVAEIIAHTRRPPAHGLLVPIPLGARRLRWRGYNQAGVIAAALARRWHLPLLAGLLRRTRDTRSQTALTPEQRAANVAGAFVDGWGWGRGAALGMGGGAAVILVDDILTTGATLAAAAAALEQARWENIGAVTFARALPFVLRSAAS